MNEDIMNVIFAAAFLEQNCFRAHLQFFESQNLPSLIFSCCCIVLFCLPELKMKNGINKSVILLNMKSNMYNVPNTHCYYYVGRTPRYFGMNCTSIIICYPLPLWKTEENEAMPLPSLES